MEQDIPLPPKGKKSRTSARSRSRRSSPRSRSKSRRRGGAAASSSKREQPEIVQAVTEIPAMVPRTPPRTRRGASLLKQPDSTLPPVVLPASVTSSRGALQFGVAVAVGTVLLILAAALLFTDAPQDIFSFTSGTACRATFHPEQLLETVDGVWDRVAVSGTQQFTSGLLQQSERPDPRRPFCSVVLTDTGHTGHLFATELSQRILGDSGSSWSSSLCYSEIRPSQTSRDVEPQFVQQLQSKFSGYDAEHLRGTVVVINGAEKIPDEYLWKLCGEEGAEHPYASFVLVFADETVCEGAPASSPAARTAQTKSNARQMVEKHLSATSSMGTEFRDALWTRIGHSVLGVCPV